MIKMDNVVKGEGYFTLTLTDNMEMYGVIFTMVPERPVTIEFVEFDKNNPDNTIDINPETNLERYKELREKYLDVVLAYLKTLE